MGTIRPSAHHIPQAPSQMLEVEATAIERTAVDIASSSLHPPKLEQPSAQNEENKQPCPRVESKFLFKSRGCAQLGGFVSQVNLDLKAK